MSSPWSRRALATVAIVVVASACAGAAGVQPAASQPTAPVVANPETTTGTIISSLYGGTVVVGLADEASPRSLNPLIEGPDAQVLDLLAPALFPRGYSFDPATGGRVPDALTGIPSLADGTLIDNGDGTQTVTVEVAEGARWADGAPITAADLAYTVDLVTDPALPIRRDVVSAYAPIVAGSLQAASRRLTFRMRAGADPTDLFTIIVPRHDVETSDFVTDWRDAVWVSGGPFEMTDWQPGQFIELTRNPSYWKVTEPEGAPLPFLDRVVVRFYEPGHEVDPRLVDGFAHGDVDVAVFGAAERRSDEFSAAYADGALVSTAASGEWDHLNFQFGPANRNLDSKNASVAFRRAVARSIDRGSLAAERGAGVVDSVLGQFLPGFGGAPYSRYEFDPLRGAEFADAAVLLTVPGDDAESVVLGGEVVTMLRDAGFDAELQLEDAAILFGPSLDDGSWDVGVWRLGPGFGVGDARAFMHVFDPDGLPFVGENYFRWGTVDSAVIDPSTLRYRDIIDEMDRTVDPDRLLELLAAAEEIIADQVVVLPLVTAGLTAVAHWPKVVSGVGVNPVDGAFWNIGEWTMSPER